MAESGAVNIWTLGCDVLIEESNAEVQEIHVDDIVLSANIFTDGFSVEVGADRVNVMDLDVNISLEGLKTYITDSQVVPYEDILKITSLSPESISEKRYASSARASKLIYDYLVSVDSRLDNAEARITFLENNGGGGGGSYWRLEDNILHSDYDIIVHGNAVIEGDTSSGGEGGDTPSTGGSLATLSDVRLSSLLNGDVLVYDNSTGMWYNVPQSSIVPDLDGYAEETWVTQNFLSSESLDEYKAELSEDVVRIEKLLSSMWIIEGDNLVTDKQVIIRNNLVVEGDTSSGGEGQDTPTEGTVTGIEVNGTPYPPNTQGVIDLSAAFNAIDVSDQLKDYYTKTQTDSAINNAIGTKADKTINITAGTGLSGGGTLASNVTLSLATSGVTAGTYPKVTVDKYGRVTAGATLVAGDIPALGISKITGLQTELDNRYTESEVNTLLKKYLLLEAASQTITGDITINGNLIVTGDTSSGGEGEDTPAGGIRGIYVNGAPYTDTDGDGFIDLGTIGGGLDESALASYLSTNNYVNSSAKITSLLGYTPANGANYLPKSGGTIDGTTSSPLKIGTSSTTIGIPLLVSNSEKAWFGWSAGQGTYLWNAAANKYLGIKEDGTPYFGSNTLIHSGNIGSYAPTYDASKNVTIDNQLWVKSFLNINRNGATGALYDASRMGIEIEPFYSYVTIKGYNTSGTGVGGINIASSGNVGIGTTAPADKLHVEGRIRMRSVMLSHISDDLATSGSYLLQYYTPSNKLLALTSRSGSTSAYKNFIFTSDWSNGHIGLCNVPSPDYSVYVTGSLGITGAVTMSSTLTVGGNITPNIHSAYNLGAYDKAFVNIHSNIISSGSNGNNLWLVGGAYDSSIGIQFARNSSGTAAGKMGSWDATGLYPATDNTFSLGKSAYLWSSVWSRKVNSANVNTLTTYRSSLNVVGWKKVAIDNKNLTSSNVIISIKRIYNNTNNETYTFLINCAYQGQTTITQIGGHANYRAISQIAVYNPASPYDRAIYIYYNTSAANDVIVNCIGDFDAITPESATLPSSNVKTMNTVSTGFATTGNAVIAGDTSSGSDIRFKDRIEDMAISISDIANAPLFTFKWNDREDDTIHLGSSAQYWERITPQLVSGQDFKSLNYATLGVAMGISLAKKSINHEVRIKALEKENNELREKIRRIEYGC